MNNNKLKIAIFVLLIFTLITMIFYSIFGVSLSYLSVKEIKQDRKLKEDLINSLKINNLDTVYDKNNNIYYYTISDRYENNNYVLKLELEDGYKYKIIGQTLNIIKVNYEKKIDIIIYNSKYYYETQIILTNLPLINIETEEKITTTDTESVFTYINSENAEKIVASNSIIHTRGNTALYFPKKSYKIKMYNEKYTNEKDITIQNFYYGSSFVLDAVYRDSSKIRNVLATTLWNDISNDFTNLDMNSLFVELFINNEYSGLYVLTEPINRTKLNLSKSSSKDTSIVLKSQGWTTPNNKMDITDIDIDTYLEYELKYPNDEELFSASWEKILSKLSNYYESTYDSSYITIENTWNIENYIDVIIFNAFINNMDNDLYKNNYFYMKSLDSDEVFIQPWDMEYSFGLNYSAENEILALKNVGDYNLIYTDFYHKNAPEINKLLINRYWKLRKNILTEEYFDSLLDEYKNQLTKGATLRDSDIWYEYDVEQEIEDIRTWIYNRLEFFDEYIEDLENE